MFSFNVSQWVERAKARADEALRAIAEDALARVKELTPVDTGHLRANWSVIKAGDEIPMDNFPKSEVLQTAKAGDVLRIINPVKYAPAIEFGREIVKKSGEKVHTQGRGMMQQTLAEMPNISKRAVQRIRRG